MAQNLLDKCKFHYRCEYVDLLVIVHICADLLFFEYIPRVSKK